MFSPAKGRREVTGSGGGVNAGRGGRGVSCCGRAARASCGAVTMLALSRYVSFHARGDAVFAWHGLTGDVAEMSRDVLALLLSFDSPRDDDKDPPAGLAREQAQEFAGILRSRRFLVQAAAAGAHPDEMTPLLAGF